MYCNRTNLRGLYHSKATFTILALFFLIFLTTLKTGGIQNTSLMENRDFVCLEQIREGTLYTNTVYCSRGIVLLYVIYVPYRFFTIYFYLIISSLAILMNLIILLFVRSIIEKETGKRYSLSLILLYGLFVYYPYLSEPFDVILCTFFFIVSLYVLFYTNYEHKEIIVSIFFFLSLFSKLTSLFPISLMVLYYLYQSRKENILKKILFLSLSFLLISVGILLIYPNYVYYYFVIVIFKQYTLSEVIFFIVNNLSDLFLKYFTLFFMVISSTILFFIRRDIFSFVISIGLPPSFLSISKGLHYPFMKYFVLFHILFFILFFIYLGQSKQMKKIFFVTTILLFYLPIIISAYGDIQFIEVQKIADKAGMQFLSNINGSYLFEMRSNMLELEKDHPFLSFKNKNITFLTPPLYQVDIDYVAIRLLDLGIAERNNYTNNINRSSLYITSEMFFNISQRIKNNEFDVIIIKTDAYLNIKELLNFNRQKYGQKMCGVYIPYLRFIEEKNISHQAHVLFTNTSWCYAFADDILTYYSTNMQHICFWSKDAAEEIRGILAKNNMKVVECE